MRRLAVIGAGIKGAALAALLAHSKSTVTTVFEFSKGVDGATATNHGRLHAGSAGWPSESLDLMRHRSVGSKLWRAAGVADGRSLGWYLFENELDRGSFVERCALAEIETRPCEAYDSPWVRRSDLVVEVAEFGFDPAGVAIQMRDRAAESGVAIRTSWVSGISSTAGGLQVRSDSGVEEFDAVVNCGGRWASTTPLGWRQEPLLEVDWHAWEIIRVPADVIPDVNRVIVRALQSGRHSTLVPHGSVVTIDVKTEARAVAPVAVPPVPPKSAPLGEDAPLFAECLQAFPALRSAAHHLREFTGVQPRLRGAKPGSFGRVTCDPDVSAYLLASGGQASTALLDALQIVRHLWSHDFLDEDPEGLVGEFLRAPLQGTDIDSVMAWAR